MLRSICRKTKMLSLITDLKKKGLMNRTKYPMMSDNGLSGDTQDIFAESEKEKGEE